MVALLSVSNPLMSLANCSIVLLISVMCASKDAPDAMEWAPFGMCNPWLLLCLYIPCAKVGIKCVKPAVE